MRPIFVILILIGTAIPVATQELPNRFTIQVGHGALTGTEEYTLTRTAGGCTLKGTVWIRRMGVQQEIKHETSLDREGDFVSYRLDASAGGQTQTLEARRAGAEITLTASGQAQPKSVPFAPRLIVLDNLVSSHYQLLLDRTSGKVGNAPEQWSVLVPQAFAAIEGKLSAGGIESATLENRSLEVRKYSMELGNVLVEFWADTGTNHLMRVAVPIQDVEIVRDGFALATVSLPAKRQSRERDVTFPSGDLTFPATLSLPESGSGRVPVVLLVHGSGPHDRDETIGPNKPFRDIANGLAQAGIATLRYEKRTFAFKARLDLKSMTIEQETIDDAVAALNYVRTLPEIDPDRVFLLGHSLGAAVAPFVAARFAPLKGAVLMAGTVRPLDELICEQTAHAMEIAKTPSADIQKKVEELKAAFRRVRTGAATDGEMVFFAPARYWRDLFGHDSAKALSQIQVPVLVLQGGKDIQVGRTDYDLVGKALASRPPDQREAHWFPDLNHLMMRVEGESTGAEYGRAATVDERVIEAIASWIRRR